MSGKVIITTPFPTPEEVAAYFKIPAKRVAELDRMIAEASSGVGGQPAQEGLSTEWRPKVLRRRQSCALKEVRVGSWMATPKPEPRNAFINVPYAKQYERVYLAFIAGIVGHGLVPTAAVRDPSSRFQLERIYELISAAQYSFHDLSWMSLDGKSPRTPRLNMAFELGLAVALSRGAGANHQWFVFDTVRQQSVTAKHPFSR